MGVGERVFAGVLGLVFAAQFLMALRYPPDPRLFPLIVSAVGVVLASALVFGAGLHDRFLGTPERLPPGRLILAIVAAPLFALGLWLFGYWIATIIAIPAVAFLLGYRRWHQVALVTVGITIALGVLFPLLNVPLPVGFVPHLAGF